MNPFEAYQMFLAMKRHFTSDYDFIKYNGKVKVSEASLEKRRDKYMFHKLAKQPDPIGLVLANLFINPSMWVGELFDETASRNYAAMKKRRETLTYTFKQELLQFDSLSKSMRVAKGAYPPILKAYRTGKVSPETLLILNDLGGIFSYWNSKLDDQYLWPEEKKSLENLRPFFSYDKERYKAIFKTVLEEI